MNGYDALNLTKLDVLDGMKEIKVAVGYALDGKPMEGFPGMRPLGEPGTFSTNIDPISEPRLIGIAWV